MTWLCSGTMGEDMQVLASILLLSAPLTSWYSPCCQFAEQDAALELLRRTALCSLHSSRT